MPKELLHKGAAPSLLLLEVRVLRAFLPTLEHRKACSETVVLGL